MRLHVADALAVDLAAYGVLRLVPDVAPGVLATAGATVSAGVLSLSAEGGVCSVDGAANAPLTVAATYAIGRQDQAWVDLDVRAVSEAVDPGAVAVLAGVRLAFVKGR